MQNTVICTDWQPQRGSISLSAMIEEKFSQELKAELLHHSAVWNTDILHAQYIDAFVSAVERNILYVNVIFDCDVRKSSLVLRQQYVINCSFDVSRGFQQLHTRGICLIGANFDRKPVLPDDLIPVIPIDQLDDVASLIIKELYEPAFRNAVPVSVPSLVMKLGLHIQYACIDLTGEVQGKIFFEDSTTAVYDLLNRTSRILNVKCGTILINQCADGLVDSRFENNTILHECVHWMLHRFAYQLQKISNPQLTAIACRKASMAKRNREWTSLDRMEWQANALAPRILMPAWSTRLLADTYMHRMAKLPTRLRIQRVAENLSAHFHASKSLSCIRLKELGYAGAELLYSAPTHYNVELSDAMREYQRNGQFRKALQEGVFAYVEKRFCIRNTRYIARDDTGELHLTSYARSHPSECCLAFGYEQYRSTLVDNGMYRSSRTETRYASFVTCSNTAQNITEMRKHISQVAMIQRRLPASFDDTLTTHMERLNLSPEDLAQLSGISDRTIKRCRSSSEYTPTKQTVVALCVGLHLPSALGRDLIAKSGICFHNGEEDIAYQMIIDTMTQCDIYECNAMLLALGVRPIIKEES